MAEGGVVDGWTERVGRWAAGRSTRRSFLGRLGRGAVLVAGGPVLVGLLADAAEARVCGQSGVSPQCPTFDCDGVWGWCWYSTGCCADGLLKKICDCCVTNYPNVHGYCPAGTNVKCIVESCGTDPRLQQAGLARLITDTPLVVTTAVVRYRFPNGVSRVLVGDGDDQLFGSVAAAAGALAGAATLLVARGPLPAATLDEVTRLGATTAYIVGPALPREIDAQLTARGLTVERVGTADAIGPFSAEVAAWAARFVGAGTVVAATSVGASALASPYAAAFAASIGRPLVFDPSASTAPAGSYLVGQEAASLLAVVPGAVAVVGASVDSIARGLADLAVQLGRVAGNVALVPPDSPVAAAMATLGAPLLQHQPDAVGAARPWLQLNRALLRRVWLGGHRGSMGVRALKDLQSVVNGYDIDRLIGVSGQGLPVYAQPLAERAVGAARLGTDPPPPRR